MKKYKMEVFDVATGKWEDKYMTIEELQNLTEAEDTMLDRIQAEYEITQKSIAMQMNNLKDPKSKD